MERLKRAAKCTYCLLWYGILKLGEMLTRGLYARFTASDKKWFGNALVLGAAIYLFFNPPATGKPEFSWVMVLVLIKPAFDLIDSFTTWLTSFRDKEQKDALNLFLSDAATCLRDLTAALEAIPFEEADRRRKAAAKQLANSLQATFDYVFKTRRGLTVLICELEAGHCKKVIATAQGNLTPYPNDELSTADCGISFATKAASSQGGEPEMIIFEDVGIEQFFPKAFRRRSSLPREGSEIVYPHVTESGVPFAVIVFCPRRFRFQNRLRALYAQPIALAMHTLTLVHSVDGQGRNP